MSWICCEHYDDIDQSARDAIRTALEYKDVEQFDYVVKSDPDPLIDVDLLETRFLTALEKSGLMSAPKPIVPSVSGIRQPPATRSWKDIKDHVDSIGNISGPGAVPPPDRGFSL